MLGGALGTTSFYGSALVDVLLAVKIEGSRVEISLASLFRCTVSKRKEEGGRVDAAGKTFTS